MVIVMLGAPASGKGTQSSLLCKEYGLTHVAMSDVLKSERDRRLALDKNDEVANEIIRVMTNGILLEEKLAAQILKDYFEANNLFDNILMDGYPRGIPSVQFSKEFLKPDAVINLDIEEEALLERVSGRVTCKDCGLVSHKNNPSYTDTCGKCGGEWTVRVDDNPETLKVRLATFKAQTLPVFEYFAEQGKLITIDANQAVDKISADIKTQIDSIQAKKNEAEISV